MPFTPLHLAAGLPVKVAAKERFSLSAFIAMNLAIDAQPALVMLGFEAQWNGGSS